MPVAEFFVSLFLQKEANNCTSPLTPLRGRGACATNVGNKYGALVRCKSLSCGEGFRERS